MSDIWIEVTISTTTEAVEAITNILFENGAQGAMIDDPKDFYQQKAHDYDWDYAERELFREDEDVVYIKTYISDEKNVLKFIEDTRLRIQELGDCGLDVGEGTVTTGQVKEEDWANNWKKYYKPTLIGDRIVIKPEWEDYEVKNQEIVVELNPGMAFGTGNHETTSMCIENLEKYVKEDSVVFDIGCGSGILGICAAKLGAKEVIGIDIDEVAVKVAKENIDKNHVGSNMTAIKGNLADDIDPSKKADVVVANIMADIVMFLIKDVRSFLKDSGKFISSGIILDKVDEVVACLEENGFKDIQVNKKGEWSCIVAS